MRRRAFVLAGCLAPHVALAAELDVWDALRRGAVVLVRHANAPGTGDPPGFRLNDCGTQRNLGDVGRAQAAALGARFRAERVLVGRVLSSQWCRAVDTAERAFPGQVTHDPTFNSFFDDRSQDPVQSAAASALIAAWRGPGALVIVTHQVNITALTGIVPAEGEGVVLQPGTPAFAVIGRLPAPRGG